jgi:hypothetical protein
MRERLAQYGGDLNLQTRPGQGFSLAIRLPLVENASGILPLHAESFPESLSETVPGGSP